MNVIIIQSHNLFFYLRAGSATVPYENGNINTPAIKEVFVRDVRIPWIEVTTDRWSSVRNEIHNLIDGTDLLGYVTKPWKFYEVYEG